MAQDLEIIKTIVLAAITSIAVSPVIFLFSSLLIAFGKNICGSIFFVLKLILLCIILIPIIPITILASLFLMGRNYFLRRSFKKSNAHKNTESSHTKGDNTPIVHFVHGTFERDAKWARENSSMYNAIINENKDIKISRFTWSAENSEKARENAANELAKKINTFESKKQYIVAHSHGGNIALRAYHNNKEVSEKVQKICLLSTPFICVQNMQRTGEKFLFSQIFGMLTSVTILAWLLHVNFHFNEFFIPLYFGILIIIAFILNKIATNYSEEVTKQSHEWTSDHQLGDDKLMIIQAIGDEADASLRFVSLAHEACFGLLAQLQAAVKGLEPWKPYAFSTLIFLITTIRGFYLSDSSISAFGLISILGIWACYWLEKKSKTHDEPLVLLLAAAPVGLISFWLGLAKAIAYGEMKLTFASSVFIYTSETPKGKHTVIKVTRTDDEILAHSTHSYQEAASQVAKWLSS